MSHSGVDDGRACLDLAPREPGFRLSINWSAWKGQGKQLKLIKISTALHICLWIGESDEPKVKTRGHFVEEGHPFGMGCFVVVRWEQHKVVTRLCV